MSKKELSTLEKFKLATGVPVSNSMRYICMYKDGDVETLVMYSAIPGKILSPKYKPSTDESIFFVNTTQEHRDWIKEIFDWAFDNPVILLYPRVVSCIDAGINKVTFKNNRVYINVSKELKTMSCDVQDEMNERVLSEPKKFRYKLFKKESDNTFTYLVGVHLTYTNTYKRTFNGYKEIIEKVKQDSPIAVDINPKDISASVIHYVKVHEDYRYIKLPLLCGYNVMNKTYITKIKAKEAKITLRIWVVSQKYCVPLTSYVDEYGITIDAIQPGMIRAWQPLT